MLWWVTTIISTILLFYLIPRVFKKKTTIQRSLKKIEKTKPRAYSKIQYDDEYEQKERRIQPKRREKQQEIEQSLNFDINYSFYDEKKSQKMEIKPPRNESKPLVQIEEQKPVQKLQNVKTPQKTKKLKKPIITTPLPNKQTFVQKKDEMIKKTEILTNKKREREFDFSTPTRKDIKKSGIKRDRKDRTPPNNKSEKKIKLSQKDIIKDETIELERVTKFETPKKSQRIQFTTPKSLVKKGLFTHKEDILAHNERVNEILSSNVQQNKTKKVSFDIPTTSTDKVEKKNEVKKETSGSHGFNFISENVEKKEVKPKIESLPNQSTEGFKLDTTSKTEKPNEKKNEIKTPSVSSGFNFGVNTETDSKKEEEVKIAEKKEKSKSLETKPSGTFSFGVESKADSFNFKANEQKETTTENGFSVGGLSDNKTTGFNMETPKKETTGFFAPSNGFNLSTTPGFNTETPKKETSPDFKIDSKAFENNTNSFNMSNPTTTVNKPQSDTFSFGGSNNDAPVQNSFSTETNVVGNHAQSFQPTNTTSTFNFGGASTTPSAGGGFNQPTSDFGFTPNSSFGGSTTTTPSSSRRRTRKK
eukprot:gene2487-3196_t